MRLPYAGTADNPPKFADPKQQIFVDKLVRSRGKAGLHVLDLAMLHSPDLTKGFMQFFTAIRGKNSLPADIMELAMCRVATLNNAAVEWIAHAPLLLQAGVSEKGLETVRTAPPHRTGGDGEGGLSKRLWSCMRYVDAMTEDVRVQDEVFDGVRRLLDDRQLIDLTLTTAGYNCVSRFLVALEVGELKDISVASGKLPAKL